MSQETILNEYEESLPLLNQFASSIESLINTLLQSTGINEHSVTSRVKDRLSLKKKIDKKGKYKKLSDITDIVGIRIISNYSDEVDKIAKLIEEEFAIDESNSIDKRKALDPDRFGYLSLHYVAKLNEVRIGLREYSSFTDINFEIQIRSILQHTWAEIEHDIGYKSKNETPRLVRRKFSQLAGLLELADSQFIQIRDELNNYDNELDQQILAKNTEILLDKLSLKKYLLSSELISRLDVRISDITNYKISKLTDEVVSRLLKYLMSFDIKTISQLEHALQENEPLIIKRAESIRDKHNKKLAVDLRYADREESEPRGRAIFGISAYYLYQILLGKLSSLEEIKNHWVSLNPTDRVDDGDLAFFKDLIALVE
ncbi:GTP pyrophosphokinase family protein [Vibrio cyclitrophicus]